MKKMTCSQAGKLGGKKGGKSKSKKKLVALAANRAKRWGKKEGV